MVSLGLIIFSATLLLLLDYTKASPADARWSKGSVVRRASPSSPTCTFIEPTPTGIICGENGYDPSNNDKTQVTEQHVADVPACVELYSQRRTDFLSFFFDKVKLICGLSMNNLDMFNGSTASSVIYWDAHCFDCPPVKCPKKLGVNLLDNGGFEDSSDLYGPWLPDETSSWSIVSPGRNSTYALRANVTDTDSIHQTFEACPGQVYLAKVDYQKNGLGFNASDEGITFEFPDGSTLYTDTSGQSAGAWTTYADIFSLPPPLHPTYLPEFFPTLGISISADTADPKSSQAVRTLDNVDVEAVSSSVVAIRNSLTRNPGFESGVIAPWIVTGPASIVSPGLNNSKYALRAGSRTLTVTQAVNLVKGKAYLLQFNFVFQCAKGNFGCSVLFTQYIFGGAGSPNRIFTDQVLGSSKPTVRSISHAFMAQQRSLTLRVVAVSNSKLNLTLDNITIRRLALG